MNFSEKQDAVAALRLVWGDSVGDIIITPENVTDRALEVTAKVLNASSASSDVVHEMLQDIAVKTVTRLMSYFSIGGRKWTKKLIIEMGRAIRDGRDFEMCRNAAKIGRISEMYGALGGY